MRSWRMLPVYSLILLTAALSLKTVQSPDLWWNLASGRWMLEHKAFLDHDVFTFTSPDIPWINRTWLWAVLFQIVFAAGGLALVCVVTSAMVTGVVAATAWTRRAGRHPVAFALLGLLVLSVAQIRFLHRPSLISDLLAPAAILLWLRWREGRSRIAAPIALAVIQILWTHLHGGFVLGLLISGGFLVEAIVARRNWRTPALILGVGIAAVLLTPWRNELLASLWGFVVRLAPALLGRSEVAVPEVARDAAGPAARNIVVEWLPTFSPMARRILGPFFVAYVALLGLTLLLVFRAMFSQRPRKPGVPASVRAEALILVALAVLSVVGLRFVGTLALGGLPLLWELLTENLQPRPADPKRKKQASRTKNESIIWSSVVTLAILLLTTSVVTNAYWKHFGARTRFGVGVMPYLFPEKLTDWMENNHVEGRFFNGYEMGSYLDWRYGAAQRVFTDTRLVSDEVYREYIALMDSPAEWPKVAAKYRLQGAMLDKRDPDQVKLYRMLKPEPTSRLVYEDPRYALIFTGVMTGN